MESYEERLPVHGLADVVRTVWIQRTGDSAVVQRHLPTGGVEIHLPLGGPPRLIGPLTGPAIEPIPARTTIVGVRFLPGSAPPLPIPLDELVDRRIDLGEIRGDLADRLSAEASGARTAEQALTLVQARLLLDHRGAPHPDPLVREAASALMPWRRTDVGSIADRLALSSSELRRRCLHRVGLSPKALQRTLRFQGFLALAQAGIAPGDGPDRGGIAGLAAAAGYADQPHLSRECLRLTGLTPRALLHDGVDRCGCAHDHTASYAPFLATRGAPAPR